ncbi:MAG: LamG domain-containing protein [Planctomycetota bacterium]
MSKRILIALSAACLAAAGAFANDGGLRARWVPRPSNDLVLPDQSGNGCDLRLGDSRAVAAPTRIFGLLDFDGLSDYGRVPGHPSLQDYSGGVTALAWVYPHAQPFSRARDILSQNIRIVLGLDPRDTPIAHVSAGGWKSVLADKPLPLDTWSHLAFSYDGQTIRLYVNGVVVKESALTGSIEAGGSRDLYLGRCAYADNNYWCGLMGTVEIFGRALAPEEINSRMEATTPKGPTKNYRLKATRGEQPLVLNGGLERTADASFSIAAGWRSNTWGENVSYFSEEQEDVHGGKSCQKVEITAFIDGGVVLCQVGGGPRLKASVRYKLEMWLKGDEGAGEATAWVRNSEWKAIPGFSRTFPVGTAWRKCMLIGKTETDVVGNVAVSFNPQRAGTYWVDDIQMTPLDQDGSDPVRGRSESP